MWTLNCIQPIFHWLLLILPICSRQLWILDIPALNWEWKNTFPSRANYSWIFNILIIEYDLGHYNTYESRRKLMSKQFTLLLFLVPSDSKRFLHTLITSLSAVWGLGRVWFPTTFVPLPPPGIELTCNETFYWGSTARQPARCRVRFQSPSSPHTTGGMFLSYSA